MLQNLPQVGLSELQLFFIKNELTSYVKARTLGLSDKTIYRIDKAAELFWNVTNGTVSKEHMDVLRQSILNKYQSEDSKGKMLAFAKAFLKYLAKIKLDTRYHAFEIFLDKPKSLKKRKNVTSRIITKDDIENILAYIKKSQRDGYISRDRALKNVAFVLFGAYTGQRSLATISRLTVEQFRDALRSEKPVLHVRSSQDKIKMEQYPVPNTGY
jgi:integrase